MKTFEQWVEDQRVEAFKAFRGLPKNVQSKAPLNEEMTKYDAEMIAGQLVKQA